MPSATQPRLTKDEATELFLASPKVRAWLDRYPPRPTTDATFADGAWTVNVWSGDAGEIATGKVDDALRVVTEAWTGPQVAWKMARGGNGAFGGEKINSYPVWLGFCVLFLLGLADWRRPLSVRNGDLLALLSFSVSLWFFNRGDVFTAIPLAYPGLLWLLARSVWIGWRDRDPGGRSVWPVWVLAAATVFLAGFRIGLNVRASNVIDVGYAGVIGADRIARGQSPYGNFPVQGDLPKCGPADAAGEVRERIQTNGRCESSNDRGDTYGPSSYFAYLPGYWIFGWTGKWDDLPAAHATSIAWDLVCLAGIALAGRRFGGDRFAAALSFAWVAWPFTQYVSSSNTNDAIVPAFLVWGFVFATSSAARGALSALSAWTKFGSLLVLPLWSGFPEARRIRPAACSPWASRSRPRSCSGSCSSSRRRRTRPASSGIGRSAGRSVATPRSPSGTGGSTTRAAYPTCTSSSVSCRWCSSSGRSRSRWWPRRRSILRLAAFTAAILIGFELVLTHWFYLYLPWFFPFLAFALLAGDRAHGTAAESESVGRSAGWRAARACRGALPRLVGPRPSRLLRRQPDRRHGLYQAYGDRMAARQVPYRDFAVEYPPGALPAFSSRRSCRRRTDVRGFEWLMALRGVATCSSVLAQVRARGRVRSSPFPRSSLGSLVLSRFDLWPAALAAAALAALLRARDRLGCGPPRAAVAAKLWPLVLVPAAVAWSGAAAAGAALVVPRGRRGVLVACFLPFAFSRRAASGTALARRRRGRSRSRASAPRCSSRTAVGAGHT